MNARRWETAAGLVLAGATAAGAGVDWRVDVQRALNDAREHGRPLVMLFRPADCGDRTAPGEVDELGRPAPGREPSECQRMDEDVWSTRGFAVEAERFVAVRAMEGSDRSLATRYQVARLPTVVFADPWGNEIVRVIGYLPRDKFVRLMHAVPSDFSGLRAAGPRLQADPLHFDALLAAGQFYATAGLPEFAERYYEKAGGTERARGEPAAAQELTVARGLNLMRMGRAKDAARLFEKALGAAPEGAGAEVLLFGLVSAHLSGGDARSATAAYDELARRFPGSPYTQRAKDNLERAGTRR